MQFNASSVPVLQVSLNSDSLNEQQLYDYGIYRVRQQLAPIRGVTLPTPAGGKYRQIMVDLDPEKLLARGLTPLDVVNAVNTQNLTLPSGAAKIGNTQYTVQTNATPATIDDLNNIPVKFANGATVLLKDVAQVRDGSAVQQNVVRADGRDRSCSASSRTATPRLSTSSTGSRLRCRRPAQPRRRVSRSPNCSTSQCSSPRSVEGCFARRRDCRGAHRTDDPDCFLAHGVRPLVVMISIPLSILTSLVVLHFLGETLNTMTLGGLALGRRHSGR